MYILRKNTLPVNKGIDGLMIYITGDVLLHTCSLRTIEMMSPENNQSGGNFVGVVFSPGEFFIVSMLPRPDQETIINGRFEQLDRLVEKAKRAPTQEKPKIPQKLGEPDWEQVTRDAQKKSGREIDDPSKAPHFSNH